MSAYSTFPIPHNTLDGFCVPEAGTHERSLRTALGHALAIRDAMKKSIDSVKVFDEACAEYDEVQDELCRESRADVPDIDTLNELKEKRSAIADRLKQVPIDQREQELVSTGKACEQAVEPKNRIECAFTNILDGELDEDDDDDGEDQEDDCDDVDENEFKVLKASAEKAIEQQVKSRRMRGRESRELLEAVDAERRSIGHLLLLDSRRSLLDLPVRIDKFLSSIDSFDRFQRSAVESDASIKTMRQTMRRLFCVMQRFIDEASALVATLQRSRTRLHGICRAADVLQKYGETYADIKHMAQELALLKPPNPVWIEELRNKAKDDHDLGGLLQKQEQKQREYQRLVETINEGLPFLRQHHDVLSEFDLSFLNCLLPGSALLGGIDLGDFSVIRRFTDYKNVSPVGGRQNCFIAEYDSGDLCFLKSYSLEATNTSSIVRRELRVARHVRSPFVTSPSCVFVDAVEGKLYMHYKRMSCSLAECLEKKKEDIPVQQLTQTGNSSLGGTVQLTLPIVLELAHQLTSGLQSLHRFQIIHGDISPRNMLLRFVANGRGGAMLENASWTDFAESFAMDSQTELLQKPSVAADALSFGRCLIEAANRLGQQPTSPFAAPVRDPVEQDFIAAVKETLMLDLQPEQSSLDRFARRLALVRDRIRTESEKKAQALHKELDDAREAKKHLEPPRYWLGSAVHHSMRLPTIFVGDAWKRSFPHVPAKSIARLEDPSMWQAFRAESWKLKSQMGGNSSNGKSLIGASPLDLECEDPLGVGEMYLFHGTSPQSADQIARTGFDPTFSRVEGLLGAGCYFTPVLAKALSYAKGIIIVARVSIGNAENSYNVAKKFRRPTEGFHTVVGTPANHTEVVVYAPNRAYAEFIVTLT